MIQARPRPLRRTPKTPCRLRPARAVLPACLLFGVALPLPPAHAYRFIAQESIPSQFPAIAPPSAWHPDVWGPGETLPFVLVDSPQWEQLSTDIAEVRDLVEEAMLAWERLPTADIRWEIEETVSPEELGEFSREKHYLTAQVAGFSVTYTIFDRDPDGAWRATSTLIAMGDEHLSDPNVFRYTMLRELGHAVGLDHASVYSRGERPRNLADGLLAGSWQFDPVMSYGYAGQDRHRDYDSMLAPDDRAGASLARPVEGWLESTGNIRGTVLLDSGDPAGLVHVLATRVREDGTMGGSVGAFTNLFGEFVIAGLGPGKYALLVRALAIRRAHPNLLPWVDTPIRDTLWASPINVRAGARAGPVTVVVSPGEERAVR